MKDQAVHKINSTWEELPTVILAEKIKKEKWAVSATIKPSIDKVSWENTQYNSYSPPIVLTIPYKKFDIRIEIDWEDRNSRGKILNRFRIESHTGYEQLERIRPKVSKTYHAAISKVQDAILILLPYIDNQLEIQKERKRYEEKLICKRKEIQLQLNDIKFSSPQENALIYRAGTSYGLHIYFDTNTDLCYINSIHGGYTIDEIRQILKIVGTNPRAVAERLLKQTQ